MNTENENRKSKYIKYNLKVNRKEWQEWKKGVPRTKSLNERLIELIREDTNE